MTRLPLLVPALALLTVAAALPASDGSPRLDPNLPCRGALSEPVTYRVDLSAVVTAPYKTKVLKVWFPIPPSDAVQQVSGSEFSTFPMKITPTVGTEKVHGNTFAYFEFHNPQGAQIVRHKFTVKTHEVRWDVDPKKVDQVSKWPDAFLPYLRSEPRIPTDDRFRKLAGTIVPEGKGAAADMGAVMDWIQANLKYTHEGASLQGSAIHALEKGAGHCSDFHGLCAALGRTMGYPARVVYGINPYPRASPSHCKLEVYLPPYGWVMYDVSEAQQLLEAIRKDPKLSDADKERLSRLGRERLFQGFRDNTWFLQTRGTDYDLTPPAARKVAVVRTIYAEADGEALPEPDPADPNRREFSWMTVHHYTADRQVTNPLRDWRTLEKQP